MDRSLIIFIAIGIGFLYFITNFIGEIQQEDSLQSSEYKDKHKYDAYQSVDSIGREILDVTDADTAVQVGAWNSSQLKKEFLTLFPDFSEMKIFAKERVRGATLQKKLMHMIDTVEHQYFSGSVDAEGAKRSLGSLK
ncbi:MAG: hypothetical protein U9O64_09240 [Campylobacterota bacterium]|nr:hypothetical protein [Campylobacterota bacterium]